MIQKRKTTMAQDVVPTANVVPLKTSSRLARLMLFAELEGEQKSIPATRARILEIGPESEIRESLLSIRQGEPPCTPERLIAYLRALAVTHPMQELSEAEASLKFRIFCEDLAQVPEQIIMAACRSYRRDPKNRFFPTPGQMIALCEPDMRVRDLRRSGAERLLDTLDRPAGSVCEEAPRRFAKLDVSLLYRHLRSVQEAGKPALPKAAPAAQEVLDANGQLSPERRAKLREMSARLRERVGT